MRTLNLYTKVLQSIKYTYIELDSYKMNTSQVFTFECHSKAHEAKLRYTYGTRPRGFVGNTLEVDPIRSNGAETETRGKQENAQQNESRVALARSSRGSRG